ncbi:preprotein translocase subunit YajC [Acinetobacter nosocomialis]|nr:preprotein translocase subunit YajC [Acinetobacter nosocomialis]MBR7737218.1 preprotein translocase subunit YajC [Acinetobacter nosocomialis]
MFSHLSHNYMLGVGILIFAFIFIYTPMVYAFFKIRKQQRKQNKL